MKEIKNKHALLSASLFVVVLIAALALLPGLKQRRRGGSYVSFLPATATAEAAETSSWTQAVRKVKEDRGEPTGKQAEVETPQQLRHYSDTRRFLAVQLAEWREHRFKTPKDFVDLADMIRSGELVQLRQVSPNYILFGVGGSTDKEPFTRYQNGERITLLNEAGLAREQARLAETAASLEGEIAALKSELGSLDKRERSSRAQLQARLNAKEKALKALREDGELLDHEYADGERRQQLFSAYESLESVAKSFPNRTYNLDDGRSRQEMKTRLLSVLRPEALKVMEEVSSAYREKFDRPLPISSLVRPDEYQYALSKVNPNATRMQTPPHSTGLAFDIYNRYMTAEEQSFVMAYLARLKDEGRIEVLRENRDHYHVFAFIDGARPDESLIRESLGKTAPAKSSAETERGDRDVKTEEKSAARKVVKKEAKQVKQAKREERGRARRR
ncbi:MAG TPA: DUF5715 family protein [Pyrinomonadaceae bacterium]